MQKVPKIDAKTDAIFDLPFAFFFASKKLEKHKKKITKSLDAKEDANPVVVRPRKLLSPSFIGMNNKIHQGPPSLL